MVQKYTAPVRVFKYPFELVMAAYEKRFPTCHLIPVFVGSDKIYENISDDGAVHVIERRCRINVDAPYLLRKITGVDHVLFIQKNTLDRRKRVLKIEAWNESFSNHINIHELCFYRVSQENDSWTIFEQQASLEVKSFWGFEHMVEKLAVKHYSQNVKKGSEIIEYHINELADEGITYIAPFAEQSSNHLNSNTVDNTTDHSAEQPNDSVNAKHDYIRSRNNNQNNCSQIPNGTDKDDHSGIGSLDAKFKNCSKTKTPDMVKLRSVSMENHDSVKPIAGKQQNSKKCESLLKKNSLEGNNGLKSSLTNSVSLN